jgi:hypothetical protein
MILTPATDPRLRLLCAGIALACASATVDAQTANDGQREPLHDANGTALRVDLAGWHAAAVDRPHITPPRAAGTLAVTDCGDGPEPGTLRNTIAGAVDGDSVDLRALTCSSITLADGVIPIPVGNLTLLGPGADALAIDGAARDRVFIHPYLGTFAIDGLTVRNGRNRAYGFDLAGGGCIAEAAYLVLADSVVSGCYAGGEGAYGGAIYAYSLEMRRSTLAGNTAYGIHDSAGTAAFGGAAFVYALDMVDSTVSGNRASHREAGRASYDIGGGIIAIRASTVSSSTFEGNYAGGRGGGLATFSLDGMFVRNSTISGNAATTVAGGGIFARPHAILALVNSTVTDNASANGGGLYAGPDVAPVLSSTIIAGNQATTPGTGDLSTRTTMTVQGSHNLIVASDIVDLPADTLRLDPHLLPLAWNGGATRTHGLAAGSLAIDAGNNNAANAFDQRGPGFPRVTGAAADIGAYEVQPATGAASVAVPIDSSWLRLTLVSLLIALGLRASAIRARASGAGSRPQF